MEADATPPALGTPRTPATAVRCHRHRASPVPLGGERRLGRGPQECHDVTGLPSDAARVAPTETGTPATAAAAAAAATAITLATSLIG